MRSVVAEGLRLVTVRSHLAASVGSVALGAVLGVLVGRVAHLPPDEATVSSRWWVAAAPVAVGALLGAADRPGQDGVTALLALPRRVRAALVRWAVALLALAAVCGVTGLAWWLGCGGRLDAAFRAAVAGFWVLSVWAYLVAQALRSSVGALVAVLSVVWVAPVLLRGQRGVAWLPAALASSPINAAGCAVWFTGTGLVALGLTRWRDA